MVKPLIEPVVNIVIPRAMTPRVAAERVSVVAEELAVPTKTAWAFPNCA
jgi:hypothetical protein